MSAKKKAKAKTATKNGMRKRTDPQKLWDRRFIAHCRMQGMSLTEITERLNTERAGVYTLSPSSVHFDLQNIEEEWKRSVARDIDTAKGRELAELDRLSEEAWKAWEKSKEKFKQVSVTVDEEGGDTAKGRKRSKVVTEDRGGDPRFMETILRIQSRRAKILGLDAPVKLSNPDGTPLASGASLAPVITINIAPPPADA